MRVWAHRSLTWNRAHRGDVITVLVTKKFWGSKDLKMKVIMSNKKKVPGEEVPIKGNRIHSVLCKKVF